MRKGLSFEAAVLVVSAVTVLFGASFDDALYAAVVATVAYAIIVLVSFSVAYVRIARHPERDKNWEAHARPFNPKYIEFGLKRKGGPTYFYGHQCTVRHPDGTTVTATEDREGEWASLAIKDEDSTFYFLYSKLSDHFPDNAPEPVTGRYEVTWRLRLKRDGLWREVVHDPNVSVTMLPEDES
jgi:hypothetical protein